MLTRRRLTTLALAAPALILPRVAGAESVAKPRTLLDFGPERAFSFEGLQERARRMAKQAYVSPYRPAPDITRSIDYDAHGKIRFRTDLAVQAGNYPVTFFHLGRYFQKKVAFFTVEGGKAREILYAQNYFDMPSDSPARGLPADSGFAGFRLQEAKTRADWRTQDWVAFLGASYYRATGELNQYGLSARGIAVDVAAQRAEEFPDFTEVYLSNTADGETVVHALLDGPSITGAYRFTLRRTSGVEIEVEKHLNLRRDIERLGIAPMSSMYWFSETRKPSMADWRPEVHDSDGLHLWTGSGERIWRPLNNPARVSVSAFADNNPRGYGLLQRDRNFDHYQDGVYYDRRPSVWIEPIGNWGAGSVQLVEIPTDDEIHDNIVAMWVPAEKARAGMSLSYRYKTFWQADVPEPGALARVVATRIGNGGQPGTPRPPGVRKFLVEFLGGPLVNIPSGQKPEAVLSVSRGKFEDYRLTEAVPDEVPGHWRTQFDLKVDGGEPVEMRCYLRLGSEVMSETWLYQYHPEG